MNTANEQIDSLRKQGLALMNGNRLEEAKTVYTKIVDLAPEDAEAWYVLSNINGRLGRIEEVGECCRRAIALRPNFSGPYVNFGHVYLIQGKPDEALAHYQTAIKLNPGHPDVYFNIGNILREQGKPAEAIENYRKALHYSPRMAVAHNNLGTIYLDQGEFEEAATCFLAALILDPHSTIYPNNFGMACRTPSQFKNYMEYYRKAVETLSDPKSVRLGFIQILANNTLIEHDSWLDEELQACLALADIDYKPLTNDAAQLLKNKYNIRNYIADNDSIAQSAIERIASDRLFILYLEKVLNVDADLEIFLTKVRRTLLLDHRQGKELSDEIVTLICSLAHQSANNEYVFSLDAAEQRYVDELRGDIERTASSIDAPNPDLERKLCLFGMYDGLYSLSCRKQLGGIARTAWPEWFLPLLDKTLTFPLEEERIKPGIDSIGMIEDETSQLVQSQYEENPYPRWLSMPDLMKEEIKHHLKQLFPHFTPPPILHASIEILIAGCGTGRQPIHAALHFESVEVLAVDISKSSLAYAIRMARKYDAMNIRFMQGDILKLSSLNKRFPIIECIGVLHHMEDPLAGWEVLTNLLMEDGLMSIALYSDTARKDLNGPRNEFRSMGLAPNRENIRKYRSNILKRISQGAISRSSILNKFDFYSTSGCRDLLFHFQEHRFTIPQISEALIRLDMKFIGFVFPAAQARNIKNSYLSHFPEDREMTNLSNWDQFEKMYPNTFSEMYQFWCQKNQYHA
jgi:Tfp pilus assembly protein PilF/ubiquinone/menaquinone biosynthesis C-methylase UbiE